jgi:methyltransferase (TIGR00027 family)
MARTDDDTWDLATSVGATATMVAAARAMATKLDDPLIDDPFAEPLVRAVGVDFFTKWASGELDPADVDDAPGFGLQMMTDMMSARTRYFDDFFHDAAGAGIRQGVILASGLDARGYRLHWADGTTIFEIDQPEVIDFKAKTLAGMGALPTTDLRFVPIDLRGDWPAALHEAGFMAAGWPPKSSETLPTSMRRRPGRACRTSHDGGASTVSTSTCRISGTTKTATTW